MSTTPKRDYTLARSGYYARLAATDPQKMTAAEFEDFARERADLEIEHSGVNRRATHVTTVSEIEGTHNGLGVMKPRLRWPRNQWGELWNPLAFLGSFGFWLVFLITALVAGLGFLVYMAHLEDQQPAYSLNKREWVCTRSVPRMMTSTSVNTGRNTVPVTTSYVFNECVAYARLGAE